MPINIRYPNQTPLVDASGLIGGLSELGDRFIQRRQEKRYAEEAADIYGRLLGPQDTTNKGYVGSISQPGKPMSLADLGSHIQRAPLPNVTDNIALRQEVAKNANGDEQGNDVFRRFMGAVQTGGVTNPAALAAIAATGKHESSFAPQNAFGTWSDPSQSGQPGTSGGIMSWRGPRLEALQQFARQNGDNPNAPSPETQAQFLIQEDPSLIQKLQQVRSPQEAQQLMNSAWKFAGFDQPGGEAGARAQTAQNYMSQFGGSPSQQALEGLGVGQSMPMGGGAVDASQRGNPISTGGFGLDRDAMAAALRNPLTRPVAIQLATSRLAAMQDQNDPMKQLAFQKALLEVENLRNPRPRTTDDMAEYQYAQRDPAFAQYQLDQRRASASQVNVGTGEKGYDKTVGEGYGKRFLNIQDESQTAQRALNALDVMEQAMDDPGFYSGIGAGTVTNLKRLGRSLGMDADGIEDIETFNAMAKQAALDTMGGSLGTGFSNADRDFVLDQVPNLQNTPEGNTQLIGIQRKINQRRQEVAQLARQYAARKGGRIDAGFDDELAQWSQANPLFPPPPAGSGANRGAGSATGRQRARNPQTGETMEWDGNQWSPVR